MRGYAGRILEVDLDNGGVSEVSLDDSVLRDYIGGRGLAVKILWDKLGSRWEEIDPLGPENILTILTGPLTGYFPGAKICVSGKSPLSNGIIGSTVSGEAGVELKCAGYDGIIITGVAEKPSYLFVCDDHVEIRDAGHVWGMEGTEALRTLVEEGRRLVSGVHPRLGKLKEPAVLYVGPAGERRVRFACVMEKRSHAAGYGGYGAVMGSKNLKAIVVKGTGPLPEPADMKKVVELMESICGDCYQNAGFRRYGTASGGYNVGALMSAEPIRNWQEEWHDDKGYSVEEFSKYWVKSYWGDFNCPTTCMKIAVIRDGEFKGAICDPPDYEHQAYNGTNLGIFSPRDNIYLSCLMNELGLCAIQAGNVLGFAAELYEKGIIGKDDLGFELRWGDTKAFAKLARMTAYREGLGDVLAEGTYRAALKISQLKKLKPEEVLNYAVQVKGVAVGAHGVRSGADFLVEEISYACSVQCGDHTSVARLPLNHRFGEPLSILHDSAVYCSFNTFPIAEQEIFQFYEAVTGWKLTPEEWYHEKAPRIIHIQRATLLLGGPDAKWTGQDDKNPPRFNQPLPSGPHKGKTPAETFNRKRKEYYEALGWNEHGTPKKETLRKLGLKNVEEKLAKTGIL
ncbi:MAG: aldehyde ferredoxin oxidoreductase C-terminal domain-containing protein [Candidatus Jordarchaeales archaeon]